MYPSPPPAAADDQIPDYITLDMASITRSHYTDAEGEPDHDAMLLAQIPDETGESSTIQLWGPTVAKHCGHCGCDHKGVVVVGAGFTGSVIQNAVGFGEENQGDWELTRNGGLLEPVGFHRSGDDAIIIRGSEGYCDFGYTQLFKASADDCILMSRQVLSWDDSLGPCNATGSAMSPDGKILAVSGENHRMDWSWRKLPDDTALLIFGMPDGALLHIINSSDKGFCYQSGTMVFSPVSPRLLIAGHTPQYAGTSAESIHFWDLSECDGPESAQPITCQGPTVKVSTSGKQVDSLAVSADGTKIAMSCRSGVVKILAINSGW